MTTPNRGALLTKTHKALKKRYKPLHGRNDQPILDALLFACCLEDARYEAAEQAMAAVKSSFFDLNEVRVSSVKELAEVMQALPHPTAAATRMKGILQTVFESDYSFDLESLKKQNIGVAVKRLQKLDGTTRFGVAYATQNALGGHSIPLDRGALAVLVVLGVINEAEASAGNVPGLERAIPKSKGQEFASLLHQLGADLAANPFSPGLRELLVSIAPDAKDRFAKRAAKKKEPQVVPPDKPVSQRHKAAAPQAKKKVAGQKKKPAAGPLAKRKPR